MDLSDGATSDVPTKALQAGIRAFAVTLGGVLLLQAGWAIALPLFRGPDEIEHVKRASGVAAGQFVPSVNRGSVAHETVRVEDDVVGAQREVCLSLHADFDPSICDPVIVYSDSSPSHSSAAMRSAAGRYNPAWYVVVAPASWLLEGRATVWGIRILSALCCAIVLSFAVVLRRAADDHPHAVAGTMFCITPAVTFASVVAAPNGLHFAAALLFWIALLSGSPGGRRVWGLSLGATIMLLTHTLAIFWIICAIVIVATLSGPAHLSNIWRSLSKRPLAIGTPCAAGAFAISWTLAVRPNDPTGGGDVLADSTKAIPAFAHGVVWVLQLVGTMPFRFGLLWPVVYVLWILAILVFVWGSLRRATTRQRLAMAVIAGLAVAVPVAATVLTYENQGYAWQGRYELPLLFGFLLVAGNTSGSLSSRQNHVRLACITAAGVSTALATLCLALREDASPVAAICAFTLTSVGWWVLWLIPRPHAQRVRR